MNSLSVSRLDFLIYEYLEKGSILTPEQMRGKEELLGPPRLPFPPLRIGSDLNKLNLRVTHIEVFKSISAYLFQLKIS